LLLTSRAADTRRGGAQGEEGRKSVTVFLRHTFYFQLKQKNWRVFLAAD
jgi:hypothetical protein